MKKLLSTVLLTFVFISAILVTGCKPSNTGSAGSNNIPIVNDGATFSRGEKIKILINGETIPDSVYQLQTDIKNALGVEPEFITDMDVSDAKELVIGQSDREVTKKALEFINRQSKVGKYVPRYVIYSDGKSVAIVFDECEGFDDIVLQNVLERFSNEFVKPGSSIDLKNKSLIVSEFDLIAYQEQKDEATLEKAWANLKAEASTVVSEAQAAEIVKALQNMYTMYDDKMLGWLADLYDPISGGFYITNSARDNEGYLPNIESTAQAMDVLRLSGMIEDYGNNLQKALPEWFKNQMISFIKNLQDPNGYFYHPQYTREQTDTHLAKKERDLTKGLDLLAYLGAKPTYTTPNGVEGDGIKGDGTLVSYVNLAQPLKESVASAVSRIIALSDDSSSSPHLASEEAFRAYLKSLEATIKRDPYTVGNDFAAQASTIYDKGYGSILREWLDGLVYESTGHWYHLNDYMGINGLMKISAAYNGINEPLPDPERLANFAIDMITTDEEELTVCYAYNTWFTVNNVINNLQRNPDHFGGADAANEIVRKIRTRLYENAPTLIAATHKKQLQFALEDGSFIYDFGVGGTQQGLPASVPNTHEGGVNPTLICMSETVHQICAALGFERVPIYTKSDYLRFISRIEELGEIVKVTEKPIKESATFDNETVGATTLEVTASGTSSSTYTVIQDSRLGARPASKVLEFNAVSDGTKSIMLPYDKANNALYQCYVFEGEYCFLEAPTGGFAYLDMGTECYALTFKGYNKDPEAKVATSIGIFEQSNTDSSKTKEMDLGLNFAMGEWFKIRIEYYVEDTTSPRVKLYVNNKLITVTGNTYDKNGGRLNGEIIKPKTYYEGANFLVYSYYDAKILMDNLACYKIRDAYTPVGEDETQPTRYNVDAPDSAEYVYGFEKDTEGKSPIGLVSSDATVISDATGKQLLLGKNSLSSVIFPINYRTRNTNCSVFEADITLNSGVSGEVLTFAFSEEARDPNALSKFNILISKNGESYIAKIYNAPTGITSSVVTGAEIPVGESFTFRAEYYDIKKITLFYINDALVASSDISTEKAARFNVERAELIAKSGTNIIVDNAKCEKIIKDFDEATKPEKDSVIYEFTSDIGNLAPTGTIKAEGGYLVFGTNASVIVPVNERSVVNTAFFYSMDIPAKSIPTGSEWTLHIKDKDGKIILAYLFKVTENNVEIYEITERKTYTDPLCKLSKSQSVNFGISYYSSKGMVYITSNTNALAASHVIYSSANALLPAASATIKSARGSSLKLDNLKFESYNATFMSMTVPKPSTNPDDDKAIIDYEGSSTGNIPTLITSDVKSVGSSLSIKEILDKDKALSKVFEFQTKNGYNDAISFALTSDSSNYNCTVFETDFKFKFTGDGSQTSYQFFLENGKDIAYAINFSKNESVLQFKPMVDRPHEDSQDGLTYMTVSNIEGWHTMKIEYYSGDRDSVRIKLYIDDKLLFDNSSFYMTLHTEASPINEITSFRIFTYGTTDASITLDNTSLKRINKDYVLGDENNPIVTDAEVLPVYGGAQSIVVLVHDDGHLPSATILDKLLRKYNLKGNVAITAKRFLAENYNQEEVDMWQAFLDTGRWGMLNHSMTHSFWGDASTGEVDEALIAYEVIESRKLLQEIFPEENFYVFAYPGISSVTNKFTESVYDAVKEVVKANYLAGRYYGNGAEDFYDWEWEWMNTYAVTLNQASSLSAIDNAVNSGQFLSILVHQIVEDYKIDNNEFIREDFSPNDPFWSRESHIEAICKRITKYVKEGKAWSATYEDAVLYLYEAENATVTTNRTNPSNIKLNVEDGLDDSIFNFPLSVKVVVNDSWEAVKVTQGGRISYAETFEENGFTYAIVDAIPDNSEVSVTAATLDEIPEEPAAPPTPGIESDTPTPPATPPSVSDDDEINMGSGNVTENDGWT